MLGRGSSRWLGTGMARSRASASKVISSGDQFLKSGEVMRPTLR